MTEYVVMIEAAEDDDNDRCIVLEPNARDELKLTILTSDQDATEWLTQEKFEELVTNARALMGWSTP